MNKIWMILFAFCLVYAFFTGNFESMVNKLFDVPKKTLEMLLVIGGLLVFYSGIYQMAIASGVISYIGRIVKPISFLLFPRIPKDNVIHDYICGNITANLLGLGLASTPMALNAIKEMKKLQNTEVASNEMITLIVVNITAFTLFPLTILTLREQYNSNLGLKIWLSLIFITFVSSVIALIIDRLFQKVKKWRI